MSSFNRLAVLTAVGLMLTAASGSLAARTKKGDKFFKEGRTSQSEERWDDALAQYEQALREDPSDPAYQMAVRRMRFEAGQYHVKTGKKLRNEGKFEEALAEFQRAYVIDPSSQIAEQEVRATYRVIKELEESKKKGEKRSADDSAALSPEMQALQEAEARIAGLQAPPDLRPISRRLNTLKMNNQSTKVLYETVGKLTGINVVFDPDFTAGGKNLSVDLTNATLEEALEYLSVLTKTYWKPLSENTIFVTNDNVTKRRDFEEMIVKVFYLENITKVQELQSIVTAVRSVTDIRRMFTYDSQNAVLVRGSRDQVALAEKLFADLDKPLAEVVVDVIVMEASRTRTRDLAASIQSGGSAGLSFPIGWTPGGISGGGGTEGETPTSAGTLPLGQLGRISVNDWSTALPGFLLQALMTDASTRILQRPQVRAADGQKASLNLGDRIPYATGSYQPGVGSVGVSPLVSTQFQFADTGVNVNMTPKIHGDDEVSLHIEIEISAVRERIDVGGLEQPVIGQRKMAEDIRVRDGEVTLLGGLTQNQGTKTRGGVPGLADIPIIKWLGFNQDTKEKTESELLIAIIPHIVRRPEITELNRRGISAGSDQVVRVNYMPPHDEEELAAPEPATSEPAKPEPAETPEVKPAAEPSAAEPPATTGATLRFNPAEVRTKPGATFTVSLLLENATDVYNAPMRIGFDKAAVKLNNVEQGTMLSGDGQQVIFTRNILNEAGTASIVLNRLPGAGGISGSGALLTLTFEALGAGTSEISLPEVTVRDSKMQPINVTPAALRVIIEE